MMKRVFAVVMSFVMTFILPASTYALSESQLNFFAQNNILFYDPGAQTCGYGTLAGSTLFEKVLSYLMSTGLNEVAAAGVYGNMMREGLGSGALLTHEDGVDSRADIGTWYSAATYYGPDGLYVQEKDVRDLDNPEIMHGLGFIQWSFGRRVNLLNALAEAGGLDQYAREWDDVAGRYVYDGMSYDQMADAIGQETTDAILWAELEFFNSEHEGYTVTADDIAAQDLSKYGITSGMPIDEALNLVSTPEEAAELFFSTSEMPGFTKFSEKQMGRATSAAEGYELIKSAGLTANGATICGNNDGTLAGIAVDLSWPYEDGTCDDNGRTVDWETNKSACYDDIKPAYKEAMEQVLDGGPSYYNYCSGYGGVNRGVLDYYQDCGHFVATVVRYSGLDPNYPLGGTSNMRNYMASSPLWQEIPNEGNTANLMPGDIFVVGGPSGGSGHIMMYTGDYSQYGDLASASLCDRTANMGTVYFSDNRGQYSIFRYVGEN